MSLPDKTLDALWYAACRNQRQRAERLRVVGNGIPDLWATDPYRYGSCIGPAEDDGEGGVVQPFTRAAIRWTPGSGAVAVER